MSTWHKGKLIDGDPWMNSVRFDPTTLSLLAIAGTVASAGVGAYSAISAGNAKKAAGQYDATVQRAEAAQVEQEAQAQAQQQQTQNKLAIGNALAAAGASGVDPNQGSPTDVLGMVAQQGELSRQLILYGGATNQSAFLNQANLSQFQGQQAQLAGYGQAGSTLLRAGGQIAQPKGPLSVLFSPSTGAPNSAGGGPTLTSTT